MRKFLIAMLAMVVLAMMTATLVFGQFDAGFLESLTVNDPYQLWNGSGEYCINDNNTGNPHDDYLVPMSNCNIP